MEQPGWSVQMPAPTAGRLAGEGAREQEQRLREETPTWLRMTRRALGVHDDERAWRRGAEGEEAVARQLAKLPADRWAALHDLTLAPSGVNLDHLVIGPAGVFALNTKKLTGRLWVGERAILHNGQRTRYLGASRHEAKTAARLLTNAVGAAVQVRPLLVIIGPELTIKQQPADVRVLTRRQLNRWLTRQPAVLSDDVRHAVLAAASRPATWPEPAPLTPGQRP